MDPLEVLVVVELEAKDQLGQQMELQILVVVVVEVHTLVEPPPIRHSVERAVQALLSFRILHHTPRSHPSVQV
jgi:hypothetical protein